MSCQSGRGTAPSLNGVAGAEPTLPLTLKACPGSPNCVSSYESGRAATTPLVVAGGPGVAQETLERVIVEDGGRVELSLAGYVWATYRSSVFRFTDDIEFLVDPELSESNTDNQTVFHVRSASRVGKSDFGVNQKRVTRLRQALE